MLAARITAADAIDVLLQDPEWLDAEFVAVMRASGLGDGFAVDVAPRATPTPEPPVGRMDRSRRGRRALDMRAEARTRSPPTG